MHRFRFERVMLFRHHSVGNDNLEVLKNKDVLTCLNFDLGEVWTLSDGLVLSHLLEFFPTFSLKDLWTLIPHLECKLLDQVVEVISDHQFIDLQVHFCINYVAVLYHLELDSDPDVLRIDFKEQLLVLMDVVANCAVFGKGLTLGFPELCDSFFTLRDVNFLVHLTGFPVNYAVFIRCLTQRVLRIVLNSAMGAACPILPYYTLQFLDLQSLQASQICLFLLEAVDYLLV